jgi:threonine dehydrogenase-like Zn-dependent dehydrogenase
VRSRSLGVAAPGDVRFFDVDEASLDDGRFAVETVFSGLSAGTELTYVKGTNPLLHAAFDADLGVFRRDRPADGYPVPRLGYMEVGRVVESRAPAPRTGELVAMAYGHKTAHVADGRRERWIALPPDLDPLLGIYVAHMGPICANGLLHAAADAAGPGVRALGDGVRGRRVAVFGAGVIGLLVGLLARHHGAAGVTVVDHTPRRLAAAAALGLEPLDADRGPPWAELKRRWRHGPADRGADVAFQCRGQVEALADALRCLRPQGTVIDLAFYAGGAEPLRLGEEFHHNGLTVRCAQIGRVPRGLAGAWDRDRLSHETIALLRAHGPAVRDALVTDVVPLEEAPALLRALAARHRHVLQAVFAGPAGARGA